MPAEDLGGLFDPLLSLYEPAKEQTFHIDESLADAVGSWEVFDDELPKKTQNQILDEIRFGPLDSNERSITRSSDEMWQFKFANQDEEIWEQFVLRGVRHKLLTFNRIKHAFESGESTNWSRVLTHWVSRSCRNVIAKSC